jgi:rhodanese-related sulfurtransferase
MVDCVQGLGKQSLNLDETSINYAPFSGHKLYAPKGIGFLYLSENTPLTPFIAGGGQESGARSGTENIPGIAALKKLFELMTDSASNVFKPISVLSRYRNNIAAALQHTFDDIVFNNDFNLSVPTTLNFSVSNMSGSEVMNLFDSAGIRVSAGSACSAGAASSFVLEAMGLSQWRCENAIRLSFGPMTSEDEIDNACQRIYQLKDKLADACMLTEVNKDTPCAVGINQYVVGDQLMYLIVNKSHNAILFNPIESELDKVNRLLAKQGILIKQYISDMPLFTLPCGSDVIPVNELSQALLNEFELIMEQGVLYLVTDKTKWPLKSEFRNNAGVSEIKSKDLSAQIAHNKIDSVIDIREQYEHQEGELNDYLLMPSSKIKNIPAHRLLNEFLVGNLSDQDHYVLVCRSGRRSSISCQLLNSFGLSKVNNLTGGVAFL